MLSYTREGGFGVTFGGQSKCFFAGFHWQQRGMNEGWSVYGGIGYSYNNFTIGVFASYNLNNGNRTIGVRAGYSYYDNAFTSGAGYARTYDSNGNYLGGGFFGYGTFNPGRMGKNNMNTSSTDPDGRSQNVFWAILGDGKHEFVVGSENGDMFTGENGLIMMMLDILGLHPYGVFHDNFVMAQYLEPRDPAGFIFCIFYGFSVAGPNPDNPYNYQRLWNKY